MSTGSSDPEPTGGERRRRRSLRGDVGTTGARFGSPSLRRSLDEEPTEQPKPPRRRRSLRGEVGATGARFGSAALRRSLEEPPDDPSAETAPFDRDLYFDPPPMPVVRQREPEPEPAVEEFSGPLVRPYAWTGGRTAPGYDLRMETLVSLEEDGIAIAMRDTTAEQRSIVEMCANPRSVAEVSALLAVPLGVARVLLGDLISMGVVAVHDNAVAAGGADFTLLERVLVGLRNL
ncbi:DUF742 domain-containing protein [Saccharothrix texasensis]|uniref:Uncharacterized protein DUF742 n=1 Tax=Saccharothrix texasensis TaxID=103734 RepID=A0A3N1H2Y8_9PSEU|nr:DUF742 domain-containing protein [Saccharothrix texasensis]ROP36858.1 uncharacterized protein DUF742 [Saccharothrix texasensis]